MAVSFFLDKLRLKGPCYSEFEFHIDFKFFDKDGL